MAEGVRGNRLVYFCEKGGLANCFLQNTGVHVVPPGLFGFGVNRTRKGGEEVLPDPFFGSVGVFSGEGVRQVYFSKAFFHILLMDGAHSFQVSLQVRDERIGKHGEAVFFAFAIADDNLVITEVNILHTQAQTFHEAQSASIENLGHQL